ncbi:hypothetical protein [Kozakia baliensis]|uniref:hypothetical protein n=2 Tax=Kozakia baliensis TaxID=153496 RepID=UPI0022300BA0|nr:hypothetical protein [Kozakia baliensis]
MRMQRGFGSLFPLILLLTTAAAPISSASPVTRDGTPTTPPPADLLAKTDAMKSACRAWIPQIPVQPLTPTPALGGTLAARQQFDTCEMVLHTEKASRMFMVLTLGSVWGGIMTLIVLFFAVRLVARALHRLNAGWFAPLRSEWSTRRDKY